MKICFSILVLLTLQYAAPAQWIFNPAQCLQVDTSFYIKDLPTYPDLSPLLLNGSTTYITWMRRIKRPPGIGYYGCVFGQALSMSGIKGWGNEGIPLSDSIYYAPQSPGIKGFGISISPVKSGGFYMCHQVYPSPSAGALEVLLKRIHGNGVQAWARKIASKSVMNWVGDVLLSTDGNGNSFVLWREPSNSLYAQRFDSTGNQAWSFPTHFHNQTYEFANLFNAGDYGFLFTTDSSWNNIKRIHRVDTAGNAYTQILDSLSPYPLPYCVLVKSDTGSVFGVTYGYTNREIRLHRLSMDLRSLWTQPKILTTASKFNNLVAVSDMKKGLLLCWSDSLDNISVLRVNVNGAKVWPNPVTFHRRTIYGSNALTFISDSAGGGIVCYVGGNTYNDSLGLYAQRIDSSGRKFWGDNGILISNNGPGSIRTISDNRHGAIIAWIGWGLSYTRRVLYTAWINANGVPYPVELSTFTAQLEGESVRLDWRTESEANNAGFEIERAIPPSGPLAGAYAAANWQRIGYVPGNGSTNADHAYIYHDALTPELLGQSELLYRLRQIDYDGTHEYSPVARVLVNPPTAVSLEAIYPNPAQGSALLRFALPSEQSVRLALYDVLGREALLVHEGSLPTGVHAYDAHLDQLPAGLYHVLLTTPLARQARRMVVTR